MAELCLDCLNKLMETKEPVKKFIISKTYDLCEECGEWKPVVVRMKFQYIIKEMLFQNRNPQL